MIRSLLLLLVLAITAAGGRLSAQSPSSLAPAGWDTSAKLTEAVDRNPDPAIVEIDIVARLAEVEVAPGKRVTAWTYDGGLPGPLIRTRLGDRLIVHLKNELPKPTTIHWHGVRVPIEMDGVPGVSQDEVKQGESFTYDFIVRDAGLYWYHPHVLSAAQVGFGLYGALLVEDPKETAVVGVADEMTLVLSDIGFDENGELEDPNNGGSTGMAFGREGDYVLVNGKVEPSIRARSGAPQRWRIVNAAKSRFYVLSLDSQPLTIIGTDGGLTETPETVQEILITPGERLDILVAPTGEPGSKLTLRSLLHNRGYGSASYRGVIDLMTVELSGDATLPKAALPTVARTITPPSVEGATRLDLVLTLPPIEKGINEFRINGVPHWKAKPYHAALGETQLWVVKNESEWDHPFHLHGFSFVVLDEQDRPVRPMAWKDTVNVPMKTTVRLLVTFDERPGAWMFHCHILDHADEGGMMGTIQVGPATGREHVHSPPPTTR